MRALFLTALVIGIIGLAVEAMKALLVAASYLAIALLCAWLFATVAE